MVFSDATLHVVATGFLVLVVLGAALIGPKNRLQCRGRAEMPIKSLGTRPILQVELARNKHDLEQVLMPGDLRRNIEDARAGNSLDTYLFIPSYSGLLISLGLILAREGGQWRSVVTTMALVAVPLISVADWMENKGIAKCLNKVDQGIQLRDSDATRISTPSLVKWALTSLVLLTYGASAGRRLSEWNWSLVMIALAGVGLGADIAATLVRYALERHAAE